MDQISQKLGVALVWQIFKFLDEPVAIGGHGPDRVFTAPRLAGGHWVLARGVKSRKHFSPCEPYNEANPNFL